MKLPAGKARKQAKKERKAALKETGSDEASKLQKGYRKRPKREDDNEEDHQEENTPAAPPAAVAKQAHLAPPAAIHSNPSSSQVHEIFVRFLPRDCNEEETQQIFASCGPLAKPVSLLRDFSTGEPKGAAFLTFCDAQGLKKALKMNGKPIRGRHLEVTVATCRKERPGLRGQQQELGTHTPALLTEVLQFLVDPDRDGIYVDATFGRGGHSRAILERLGPKGKLHGLDMDPEAVEVGRELEQSSMGQFSMHQTPFSGMKRVLPEELKGELSGVLFDLGISSPQLDDPSRGMRPEQVSLDLLLTPLSPSHSRLNLLPSQSGPLDLRFDISMGEPAWQLLETLSREELASILAKYGDGQDAETAERIADTIALYKEIGKGMPTTTSEFSDLVSRCRMGGDYQRMHAAKLTFQALRMHINSERKEMMKGMQAAYKMLKDGGRIGVISWKHSEAALVMDFIREHELASESYPLRTWIEAEEGALKKKFGLRRAPAIYPGAAELGYNSRARSAVLHILIKEKGVRVSEVRDKVYEKMKWERLDVPRLHSIQ